VRIRVFESFTAMLKFGLFQALACKINNKAKLELVIHPKTFIELMGKSETVEIHHDFRRHGRGMNCH
jgi:hypothetical protein